MIEQLMIFALGFLLAGLLTLMFLPAMWRRAQRLSQRRVEQRLPVSMAEVAAERDQLRAAFAVEHRRIEQANESLVETRARDLAELTRRGARIAALQADVDAIAVRAAALEVSLADADRRAAHAEGVWAALQKEVQDSAALAHRRMEDSVALQRGLLAASDLAETRRIQIAGLETQVELLEAKRDNLSRDLANAQLQLAEKTSAAELLAKERDFARSDLAAANARREALQKEMDDLSARLAEQERDLRDVQRARTRMANEIADQARTLEAQKATEAELRAQSAAALAAYRQEARRTAENAQELRAQRDAMQGALEAVRREAQSLRDDLARARQAAGGTAEGMRDDEILRQAISDIGAEVLRLTTALERQAESLDDTPAERVQRLQKQAGRASSVA